MTATWVSAMVTHGTHLAGNEVVHLMTLGSAPYVQPGLEARFRHAAFFIGANVRQAVQEGRADFMPVFLSEIPQLITSGRVHIDVALIQVSPPDRLGFVSLGVSVDVVRAAVDTADLILAEVNPNMPRTLGDSFLHVDRIAQLVPVDVPLPERSREPLDDVCREIGRNVASLIPDGATLQMGIGKIPDATLAALTDRRDLGIHTEMLSDGARRAIERGVVTGRRKSLHAGKSVITFALGSPDLYEFLNDNAGIEARPVDYVNDPTVIQQIDRMVAINSALEVDLTGQVCSDSIGTTIYSGFGGQVDFIRGAARAPHGKPIIALPSAARGGTTSRIVSTLKTGAGVVTSRADVHWVVTEHGAVNLFGKNLRERALALIGIAHPDFRDELERAAQERKLLP